MLKSFEEFDRENREPDTDSDMDRRNWLVSLSQYNTYATDYTLNRCVGKTIAAIELSESDNSAIMRFTDGSGIQIQCQDRGVHPAELAVRPIDKEDESD